MKLRWKSREKARPPKLCPGAYRGVSIEIAGLALNSLALFAFGHVLDLAVFKNGLHFNFAAAGAVEALGAAGGSRVF